MEHKEEWKDVSEHLWAHENYECSNTGFIRRKKNKRILKAGKDTQGYFGVYLSKNNIGKRYAVHKIICLSWIMNPENLQTIDHINSKNITDNSIWNLRWATRQQQELNKNPRGKSGMKGVVEAPSGRWKSGIRNPETKEFETLGTFDTKEEAGQAFDKRALELHQSNIGFLVLNNCNVNF